MNIEKNMTTGTEETRKQELYTFRGKTFYSDERIIKQLNYALALNRSTERYEKVNRKTDSED
jgi:hypothetical protein